MPDFSRRSGQIEMMDDPAIGYDAFRACLVDLEFVNRWSLAYRPTLDWLRRQDPPKNATMTLFDIGSGGGDMLRLIRHWASKHKLPMRLIGIDLNPWSKNAALSITPPKLDIFYETTDIFAIEPDRQADFITSSLFTHHLTDDQLVDFIRWMDQHARRGWFINDLHRHRLAYFSIKYLSKLLRLDRMVQHDGPISVARAFRRADWMTLLARAGIDPAHYRIEWYFPFRYCVARQVA